ncbi:MAG: hypothetical protein KF819_11345 [Labilithrix sp.]|nr:hypothetical protein [Labilithrix sp.]
MRKNWKHLAAALVLLGGCKKTDAGARSDAGTSTADASALRPGYDGPLDGRVVARLRSHRARVVPLHDGKVIVDAGIFVYDVTPDGGLRLVGEPGMYALVRDDENLGGYDVSRYPQGRTFLGSTSDELRLLTSNDHGEAINLAWAKGAWAKAPAPALPQGLTARTLRDDGPGKPVDVSLPGGIVEASWTIASNGDRVALGRREPSGPPVSAIARAGANDAKLVAIDLPIDDGRRTSCEAIASWSAPHVACHTIEGTSKHYVLRLDGDRWTLVKGGGLGEEPPPSKLEAAVGPDGSLWFSFADDKITRLTRHGKALSFELPRADASLTPAAYESGEEIVSQGNFEYKRWEFVAVHEQPASAVDEVRQIVPVRDGEVLVLARERGASAHVLIHLRKPSGDIGALPDPIAIGTDTDQRVAIQNAKPVRTWVGHCPQLFVTLEKQRADGSSSADRVFAREKEIAEAVKALGGRDVRFAPTAAIVQGRLGDRQVGGVLLWRALPDAKEELLEKTARGLADRFAESPASPPAISCTAPVLERAKPL